jgi:hypothetical protein
MPIRYVCLMTVLAAALLVPAGASAAEPKAGPPDFEGKFLALTLRSNTDTIHTLGQVQLRKLGDHTFLVGVGVDSGTTDKWYVGLIIWVALSDVSEIQVYPTQTALRKAFAPAGDEGGGRKTPKK